MNTSKNIAMVLGETKKINFTVVDPNGDAVDLTGATAVFAVSDGVLADRSCTIAGNICTVTINPADIIQTGTFGFEFRIKDSLQQVDSLLIGNFTVSQKHTTTM